jgi:hypothetical protein
MAHSVLIDMRRLLLVAALAGSSLGAQTRSVARVRVVDSARVAIADANVSVVKGLNETLASATTDADGRRMLTFDPGDIEIVVRKIGFARASRFIQARPGDTTAVEITLARSPQTLGAVKVVEREDLKRKSYAIDAEEIASSTRGIVDARDVVKKLRPDIIQSRGGSKVCPPALRIWVNGVRQRLVRPSDALVAGKRMSIQAAKSTPHMAASGIDALPLVVGQVLSEIKAEHIAEMTYRDCMDFTVDRANAESSIFIALKPGVAYRPGVGSFVSDAGVIEDVGPRASRQRPVRRHAVAVVSLSCARCL